MAESIIYGLPNIMGGGITTSCTCYLSKQPNKGCFKTYLRANSGATITIQSMNNTMGDYADRTIETDSYGNIFFEYKRSSKAEYTGTSSIYERYQVSVPATGSYTALTVNLYFYINPNSAQATPTFSCSQLTATPVGNPYPKDLLAGTNIDCELNRGNANAYVFYGHVSFSDELLQHIMTYSKQSQTYQNKCRIRFYTSSQQTYTKTDAMAYFGCEYGTNRYGNPDTYYDTIEVPVNVLLAAAKALSFNTGSPPTSSGSTVYYLSKYVYSSTYPSKIRFAVTTKYSNQHVGNKCYVSSTNSSLNISVTYDEYGYSIFDITRKIQSTSNETVTISAYEGRGYSSVSGSFVIEASSGSKSQAVVREVPDSLDLVSLASGNIVIYDPDIFSAYAQQYTHLSVSGEGAQYVDLPNGTYDSTAKTATRPIRLLTVPDHECDLTLHIMGHGFFSPNVYDIFINDYTIHLGSTTNTRVYLQNEWKKAQPKVYYNGAWRDATTYVYTGGEWKKA